MSLQKLRMSPFCPGSPGSHPFLVCLGQAGLGVLVRSSPDNHSGLPKLSTTDLGRVPQWCMFFFVITEIGLIFFWSDGGPEKGLNYPGSHRDYMMAAQEVLFSRSCI